MNSYTDALSEYECESEDGRAKLIYAYFGASIYHGQCLEEELCQMLWLNEFFNSKEKTKEYLNTIIDKHEASKKTLGQSIGTLKKVYIISDEDEVSLGNILKKRNFLVHKYFRINVDKFFSEVGKKEMLKYFCEFIESTNIIEDKLKTYSFKYAQRLGITSELINKYLDILKETEKKRDYS
ncbi:MAG: DUF86 domain-containing protein [Lentisphaeraceae bacterium]|nr:DUF86 domain-containing protein [Lentisphaeraceae bacterium]